MSAFPIFAVSDVGRAVAFYEQGLGFERRYRWPPDGELEFAYLKRNEDGLGLVKDEPGRFSLCVYVGDVDAKAAELQGLGARELEAPADQPWGERTALYENADGHRILLVMPR